MKIWCKKTWSPIDIVLLKWSCILFGVLCGAFFPSEVKNNMVLIIVVMLVLAAKPTASYLLKNDQE